MQKRKELSDPNSCLNKAKDDELIFVLVEHDVTSPDTVRDWVARRLDKGKNKITDPQIIEALAWADKVEEIHTYGKSVRNPTT